ncbi:sll0413 [Synechocystis sp. PCC 6803]|uniref:Sll0413 protein n=2 Tax=Synechocystis TaxID=1142 RepID=Q55114_SYNY3|nr:hypothetical protein MYO_123060 [Synechocystis sp. PCC 6803]AVP90306.1 DUF3038 domain-containing protein [Synechocystis sp. IPPAS B-1465]BAL30028.1 hypothetical protein SYNGTI_2281 [Synechocystis sp. PCC 6803 substr. GT-I]BAL33197.1 hypothetical protein SYNPCCN_2280 [Synechocystis sp. PCC 6803 substr. PCC-N]BAL36366.1 hypothetical protein SYNPCCP_2280 [Synechocystis sp. PCC 6803 substr. PCC-P]
MLTSPMSDAAVVVEEQAAVLKTLPDFPLSNQRCASQLQQRLDLLLLAIEALDVGSASKMLASAESLGLQSIIPHALALWRLRCTNPWRRSYNRTLLTLDQAKALTAIAHYQAKPLNVTMRQLLIAERQMRAKQLPVGTNFLLSDYLDQFRSHFSSRMNPRRAKVSVLLASEPAMDDFALGLLNQLMFCTGTIGMERLWISLFDGEVA